MISNFTIFFIVHIFVFKFFSTNIKGFYIFNDSCCILLITSFFLKKSIIFIACSLKDLQNFFIQSLPMFLNDGIVYIEKINGICSPNFVVDGFSGLFLHP